MLLPRRWNHSTVSSHSIVFPNSRLILSNISAPIEEPAVLVCRGLDLPQLQEGHAGIRALDMKVHIGYFERNGITSARSAAGCSSATQQKPYYNVHFAVLEPKQFVGSSLPARRYCTAKALWKLSWFLRDFGYDTELLGRDELDEKCLVGLLGVIKVSHTTVNGRTYLNLDAFAPAGEWDEFMVVPPSSESEGAEPEVA
jgi:hypothetical protein